MFQLHFSTRPQGATSLHLNLLSASCSWCFGKDLKWQIRTGYSGLWALILSSRWTSPITVSEIKPEEQSDSTNWSRPGKSVIDATKKRPWANPHRRGGGRREEWGGRARRGGSRVRDLVFDSDEYFAWSLSPRASSLSSYHTNTTVH